MWIVYKFNGVTMIPAGPGYIHKLRGAGDRKSVSIKWENRIRIIILKRVKFKIFVGDHQLILIFFFNPDKDYVNDIYRISW